MGAARPRGQKERVCEHDHQRGGGPQRIEQGEARIAGRRRDRGVDRRLRRELGDRYDQLLGRLVSRSGRCAARRAGHRAGRRRRQSHPLSPLMGGDRM